MTIDEQIEMDASIMDGVTLEAGGVACIKNVANPIKVARLVMEKVRSLLIKVQSIGASTSVFFALCYRQLPVLNL